MNVGLIVVISASFAVAGQSGRIALASLENRAELSSDEVATLSNSISARFLEKVGKEGILLHLDEELACDEICARGEAGEVGADIAVTGVVKTFGGAFIVELVAMETGTGKLIGRGSTPPAADLLALLSAVEELAEKFFDRLSNVSGGNGPASFSPTPVKVYPDRTSSTPMPDQDSYGGTGGYGVPGPSDSAVIHVTSKPSGATVRIGGVFTGPVAGKTPLTKHLKPGIYTVTVDKDGFSRKKKRFRLHMGDSIDLDFKLNPYVTLLALGHGAFWSGMLLEIPGLVMLASSGSSSLSTALCAGGGVLLATAFTLWIVRGVKIARYNKKRTKIRRGLTVLPSRDQGVAVAYGQTF